MNEKMTDKQVIEKNVKGSCCGLIDHTAFCLKGLKKRKKKNSQPK
jgi:hypothetical protein